MTKQRSGRHSHHRRRLSIEPAAAQTSNDDKDKPDVRLISYNQTEFIDKVVDNLTDIPDYLGKNKVVWIDINGIRCHKMLKFLGESFEIHNLCLEDVINTQRPKLEQYGNRFFLVLQQLTRPSSGELNSFQVAMAFGKGYLVTFHDGQWKLV